MESSLAAMFLILAVLAASCAQSNSRADVDAGAGDATVDSGADAQLDAAGGCHVPADCTVPNETCDVATNACECIDGYVRVAEDCVAASTFVQQAYVKASSTSANDNFGVSFSLSRDGNTLVVGAWQADEERGAAYVFARAGAEWVEQSVLVASNADEGDQFGTAVSISDDGDTVAVGAILEASSSVGVGGDQSNNSSVGAGAVYVFTRSGSTWSQQAYLKASNAATDDHFGRGLSLSALGDRLAVGAAREASGAFGIDGDQHDDSAERSGAVYLFVRDGAAWSQEAYVKASNTGSGDFFGVSVALSDAGDTLVVGATSEASDADGVNGDEEDNSADASGAAYVFARTGSVWVQQAYLKAASSDTYDVFGCSVAISSDGNTLAVGAPYEASGARGVDGDYTNNELPDSGAIYLFTRVGSTWTMSAYFKALNPGSADYFGESVALSGDGDILVVGAPGEDSNGDPSEDVLIDSGAVYLFRRTGPSATWVQSDYLKASNIDARDVLGGALAISAGGDTLAVGALGESSSATGIDGDQTLNDAEFAGAAYIFGHP